MGPDRDSMRRRSPSLEPDRKRHHSDVISPERVSRGHITPNNKPWDAEAYENSRRISSQHVPGKRTPPYSSAYHSPYRRSNDGSRGYENGYNPRTNGGGPSVPPMYMQRSAPIGQATSQQTSKSRRLYIGNVPYHAGLTDVALTQFFSALYIAGFRPNKPGEPLPVVSFWLHADGKFGFMELRGEQETVNMMQFNGVFLHGRPLRVNRPSDYKPEIHNPNGMSLIPDEINVKAVTDLCEQLGPIVTAPAQLAAIAASQTASEVAPRSHGRPSHAYGGEKTNGDSDMGQGSSYERRKDEDRNEDSEKATVEAKQDGGEAKEDHSASEFDAIVLALKDLITEEDLEGDDEDFQEILEDIETVCGKIAKVVKVHIPRDGSMKQTAFVQFETSEGAHKAKDSLSKAKFDGRAIVAIPITKCETAIKAAEKVAKDGFP